MGTDIHLQVQGKRADGVWEYVKIKPFFRYDDPGFSWDDDPSGRNYNLFALLADVRNGHGFAGSYRHEPVRHHFGGCGLPDGLTPDDCYQHDEDGDDLPDFVAGDAYIGDHSFTHATLAELRAVTWDQEFESGGIVDEKNFRIWQERGVPESWSGGIWGDGIVVHEPLDYVVLLADGGLRYDQYGNCRDYCRVTWTWQPLVDCAFRRWVDGERMAEIAEVYGGPQNVRVLIGFDS